MKASISAMSHQQLSSCFWRVLPQSVINCPLDKTDGTCFELERPHPCAKCLLAASQRSDSGGSRCSESVSRSGLCCSSFHFSGIGSFWSHHTAALFQKHHTGRGFWKPALWLRVRVYSYINTHPLPFLVMPGISISDYALKKHLGKALKLNVEISFYT